MALSREDPGEEPHQMPRNVYPMLEGPVLALLDGMKPGEILTLARGDFPEEHRGANTVAWPAVSAEAAAMVLLSVFPLERDDTPIMVLDRPWYSDGLPDIAFVVSGIAADSERRRIPVVTLGDECFFALADRAVVTVLADEKASPCAFVLRKGGSTA